MELEVKYRSPDKKIHVSRVKTFPTLFDASSIDRAIYRAGRNIILTTNCPWSGTQIQCIGFRLRPYFKKYQKFNDFHWTITEAAGKWSRWYDYDQFFGDSFPEIEITTVKVIRQRTRRG